jgi:hypothetical protein
MTPEARRPGPWPPVAPEVPMADARILGLMARRRVASASGGPTRLTIEDSNA